MASHAPIGGRAARAALAGVLGAACFVRSEAGAVWTAVETKNAPPDFRRVGMAMMERHNALYIFGHAGQFYRYRMTSRIWENLRPTGVMPWDAWWFNVHYMCAVEDDQAIYLYLRRWRKDHWDREIWKDVVFRYDASVGRGKERDVDAWTHVMVDDGCEEPTYHLHLHQGRRAIYAIRCMGWHSYSLDNNTWQHLDPLPDWLASGNRFGPIASVGSTFYIFTRDGLHTWNERTGFEVAFVQGPCPEWREWATMVAVEEERALYLFGGEPLGGESIKDRTLNDLWRFDRGTWTEVPAANPWPQPRRSAFAAAPRTGREFYLTGGDPFNEWRDQLWLCDASMQVLTPTTTTTPAEHTIPVSTAAGVAVAVGLGSTAMAAVAFAAGLAYSRLQRPARVVGLPERVGAEMTLTASRQ